MANNEQISALMDGDLRDKSTFDTLINDPSLQATWGRYHLIGDVMRAELPEGLNLELGDRVMAALADEPTLFAPVAQNASRYAGNEAGAGKRTSQADDNVIPFWRKAGQQLGQYAIAASVAAAVIFGVQEYQREDVSHNPVLNTIPVGGSAAPVSVHYPQAETTRPATQGMSEQQMQEQRERINAFLRDHQLQQRLLQDRHVQR